MTVTSCLRCGTTVLNKADLALLPCVPMAKAFANEPTHHDDAAKLVSDEPLIEVERD